MSAKFFNDLRFYCLDINESPEIAEQMENDFKEKFNALGKYSQMDISLVVATEGWEEAFRQLKLID